MLLGCIYKRITHTNSAGSRRYKDTHDRGDITASHIRDSHRCKANCHAVNFHDEGESPSTIANERDGLFGEKCGGSAGPSIVALCLLL